MDIAQKMFNGDPDLLKKVITGEESWADGYDIETKAQSSSRAKTEKSMLNSVKCEGIAHCFPRLQWRGASLILATRSIKNITSKLYADCAKQLVRNA